MLLVVPWQLLGESAGRRPWQSLLYAILYALLLPFALLLASLDGLDRRRHFTHGYALLCRPARALPRPPAASAPLQQSSEG